MLRIISGEQGKVRDWEAFRNLFLPTANFTVLYHATDPISLPYETVSLDDFINMMDDPYYDEGFLEYELGKVVDEYNGIAHVFQSFNAKDSDDLEEKGITSYQLLYTKNRWWIVNVIWTGNSNGVEIPNRYLSKKK